MGKMETIRLMHPAHKVAGLGLALSCAVACLLCALAVSLPQGALADESGAESTTAGQASPSLTLKVSHEEDGEVLDIDGCEFTLYQVADLGPGNAYRTLPAFSPVDVDFNRNLTAAEAKAAADAMAAIAKSPTAKATTDDDGVVKYENLDKGVYLVVQTARKDTAEMFLLMPPFLINVPQYVDGQEILDVVATPKPEFDPEWHEGGDDPPSPGNPGESTSTSSKSSSTTHSSSKSSSTTHSTTHTTSRTNPRTGDEVDPFAVALCALVGVGAMFLAIHAARKRRE